MSDVSPGKQGETEERHRQRGGRSLRMCCYSVARETTQTPGPQLSSTDLASEGHLDTFFMGERVNRDSDIWKTILIYSLYSVVFFILVPFWFLESSHRYLPNEIGNSGNQKPKPKRNALPNLKEKACWNLDS